MKTILSLKKLALSCSIFVAGSLCTNAQTNLTAGDVAVIGMLSNSTSGDTGDEVSWIPLVDLEAGTVIYFTDSGYFNIADNGNGGFPVKNGNTDPEINTDAEGVIRFTAPSAISAGTVQTITNDGSAEYEFITSTEMAEDTELKVAKKGDTVIVFQSNINPSSDPTNFVDPNNMTAIFQVSSNSMEFISNGTGTAEKQTDLFPTLTDGTNAIAFGRDVGTNQDYDNIRYIGTTTFDTKAELLASIMNKSNWEGTHNDTDAPGYSSNNVTSFVLDTKDFNQISFSVTPNPTAEFVNISTPFKKVEIHSLTGSKVMEADSNNFSVKNLTNGVYFVVIEDFNGSSGVEKFVKN